MQPPPTTSIWINISPWSIQATSINISIHVSPLQKLVAHWLVAQCILKCLSNNIIKEKWPHVLPLGRIRNEKLLKLLAQISSNLSSVPEIVQNSREPRLQLKEVCGRAIKHLNKEQPYLTLPNTLWTDKTSIQETHFSQKQPSMSLMKNEALQLLLTASAKIFPSVGLTSWCCMMCNQ